VTSCPPDEQLTGLLADTLSTADQDAVARHVEGCPSCQEKLARWTRASEVETWRRAEHPPPGSEAEEGLVRRLKGMLPSPAPTRRRQAAETAGDSPPAGDSTPAVPGYEILGELGRGGMGVVYKARQVALQRTVALKMVLTGAHAGPKDLARFRAEAAVIARLQHPNIVQIYDVGEVAGRPYFALEFVAGGSLAQHLQGTPQPVRPATRMIETLARAVHAAHANGVVHRDLKPANILLASGGAVSGEGSQAQGLQPLGSGTTHPSPLTNPKITDFGLAKCLDGDGEAPGGRGPTVTGDFLGTPNYMAPEQAMVPRQPVGPAADVYALGAILYELLTGRPPFRGETPLETVLQVLHTEPVSVTRLQPNVPADLETICLKCLQKEPRKRYGSALDLAEDLRRFLHSEPIRARSPSALYRWGKFAQRNKPLVGGVVGILLALTVGAIAAGVFALGEADQRRRADLERDAALRQASYARLAAAGAALRDDDVAAAASHLDFVPVPLRAWEWHHLHSRLDDSAAVFRPPDQGQMLLASSDQGIRLVSVGPDSVHLIDPDGGESLPLPGGGLWLKLVEHTARGTRVFACEKSGHLVVLDESRKVQRRLDSPPGCRAWQVAVSPDHTRLLVDWGETGPPRSFALYDLASGRSGRISAAIPDSPSRWRSARTARRSPPVPTTTRFACGTRRRAPRSRCSVGTPPRCGPLLIGGTASGSSRPRRTARFANGTSPRASRSAYLTGGIAMQPIPPCTVRTGGGSLPAVTTGP
jgi:serine/threonine protein kinase